MRSMLKIAFLFFLILLPNLNAQPSGPLFAPAMVERTHPYELKENPIFRAKKQFKSIQEIINKLSNWLPEYFKLLRAFEVSKAQEHLETKQDIWFNEEPEQTPQTTTPQQTVTVPGVWSAPAEGKTSTRTQHNPYAAILSLGWEETPPEYPTDAFYDIMIRYYSPHDENLLLLTATFSSREYFQLGQFVCLPEETGISFIGWVTDVESSQIDRGLRPIDRLATNDEVADWNKQLVLFQSKQPILVTVQFYGTSADGVSQNCYQQQFVAPSHAFRNRWVIVPGDRGEDMGRVVDVAPLPNSEYPQSMIRFATPTEVENLRKLSEEELACLTFVNGQKNQLGIQANLTGCRFQFDQNKLIIWHSGKYFNHKILTRRLFKKYGCRIWCERDLVQRPR